MDDVHNLLEQLAPLVKEYEEKAKKRMDTGFNVFYLISDYYYRETFHGDILYALLSPQEKHGEGPLFVELFIDMINKEKQLVEKKDYRTAAVEREYGTKDGDEMGRIDLLINGENNHCVVIENKLNDAGDTVHQLPKYRNDLTNKGYIIDAFVYIPKNPDKWPDTSDWNENEIKDIKNKLVVLPAYKVGQTNLIDNWLTPAENQTQNSDARFVIKHYKELLKNLTIDVMDTIILEKFYNVLLQEDNLKTAQSIRDMLIQDKGIPGYMANRIKYSYQQKCSPFSNVHIHKDRDTVFEGAVVNGIKLKFDIWCYDTGYKVVFWTPDEKVNEEDFVQLYLKIKALKDFEKQDGINWYVKHFKFTDENGLFGFLDQVLSELRQITKDS